MPPLEERTEYPYQNIRVKNYPWGDGDKVSPFYPLPTELLDAQKLIALLQTIL
jgi:cytochrome c oxidase subunit 6a